jgi:hypothetical protein
MKAILLIACLAAGEQWGILPSAAPDQTDSEKQPYLYWVNHNGGLFSVYGFKRGPQVWFDKALARNKGWEQRPHKPEDMVVGPMVRNQGVQLDRTSVRGFEAGTTAGKNFVAAAGSKDGNQRVSADLFLTIYGGTKDERDAVVRDLDTHPMLVPLRPRLRVQSYPGDNWAVDPLVGFPPAGRPTIMVQTLDGFEVWRAEDYKCGPEGLAKAIGSVRRRDPDYDPSKTPGPGRGGGLCPLGFTASHIPLVVIGIVLVGWLIMGEPKART